ncbi:MAG: heat-inducible transcriptional repressor HrcA, partial [Myxococcota bacterium]
QDREHLVLLGLVDFFLKTGKPVGSNTLKKALFQNLSSATIRNYFTHLEQQGFLHQQHSSGGRTPTYAALRLYAKEHIDCDQINPDLEPQFTQIRRTETKEIAHFLQQAADTLSHITQTAVFISSPRFDHDFISSIRVIPVDTNRCVCILISDFGVIQTELLHIETKMSAFSAKRIEEYFEWRIAPSRPKPSTLSKEEETLANKFYNELLVRYIVGYTNFTDEETYRTGFSKLLHYPEFEDTSSLASSLALFENPHSMRLVLRDATSKKALQCWIGDDLSPYAPQTPNCSVIAAPYSISQQCVGAIGLLGPVRIPYRELFSTLRHFAENLGEALTRNIYKYKVSYRQPTTDSMLELKDEHRLTGHTHLMLIEDHRSTTND